MTVVRIIDAESFNYYSLLDSLVDQFQSLSNTVPDPILVQMMISILC